MESVLRKWDTLSAAKAHTLAETVAALEPGDGSWDVLRRASDTAVYAEHAGSGLTHFIFSDGSVLVSHRWGQDVLAIDPFDAASWQGYHLHMEAWGTLGHIITPTNAKDWRALCSDDRCAKSTAPTPPCRPELRLLPSATL